MLYHAPVPAPQGTHKGGQSPPTSKDIWVLDSPYDSEEDMKVPLSVETLTVLCGVEQFARIRGPGFNILRLIIRRILTNDQIMYTVRDGPQHLYHDKCGDPVQVGVESTDDMINIVNLGYMDMPSEKHRIESTHARLLSVLGGEYREMIADAFYNMKEIANQYINDSDDIDHRVKGAIEQGTRAPFKRKSSKRVFKAPGIASKALRNNRAKLSLNKNPYDPEYRACKDNAVGGEATAPSQSQTTSMETPETSQTTQMDTDTPMTMGGDTGGHRDPPPPDMDMAPPPPGQADIETPGDLLYALVKCEGGGGGHIGGADTGGGDAGDSIEHAMLEELLMGGETTPIQDSKIATRPKRRREPKAKAKAKAKAKRRTRPPTMKAPPDPTPPVQPQTPSSIIHELLEMSQTEADVARTILGPH
eukprot:GHVO01063749.1.p1 GENE.GHVO01063749.1~~GHVO01063749.1.p1  ORF type:complete len:418 (+),score=135.97 GHVO01063749.1:2563-3816(+)